MRVTGAKLKPIDSLSKVLLAPDLLTPATPLTPDAVTPSSSTAFSKWDVQLSEPPTPTSSSFGTGILVRLSDGELAVRSIRKILRIDGKDKAEDAKGKVQELSEGEEVEFRTDGCKAFDCFLHLRVRTNLTPVFQAPSQQSLVVHFPLFRNPMNAIFCHYRHYKVASPPLHGSFALTQMAFHAKLPPVELVTDFSRSHEPVKRIFTGDDISAWLQSEAYNRVMTVLVRGILAIRGRGRRVSSYPENKTTLAVTGMLDQLNAWIDDIPLDTGVQRFGNKAFRKWGERLEQKSESLHRAWLPESHLALLPELLYYFNNAFGNWTRIDYGSGHELSFLGYLTVLRYAGLWLEEDEVAMIFTVFERYLRTCRKLQAIYTLEPAGSKGVWGLEDHQFLNFLWGSSQLIGHDSIRPADIMKRGPDLAAAAPDYLYLSSIEHINKLKRGPFHEHSPILYSIATTVPNWGKVNSGLMKMYQAEVLEKHTVVQHFFFGDILPWRRVGTGEALPTRIGVDDKDEDNSEDADFPESKSTKAPWVDAGDQHPVSTTVAPWTSMSTGTMPATAAPWASRTTVQPTHSSTAMPSRFTGPVSHPSRQGMHTLASTGSAAAISSPLGVISQPIVRTTRKPTSPQD